MMSLYSELSPFLERNLWWLLLPTLISSIIVVILVARMLSAKPKQSRQWKFLNAPLSFSVSKTLSSPKRDSAKDWSHLLDLRKSTLPQSKAATPSMTLSDMLQKISFQSLDTQLTQKPNSGRKALKKLFRQPKKLSLKKKPYGAIK